MPESRLVRIKPYNPRRGYVMRRYSVTLTGKRYVFEEGKGWYTVPIDVAEYLSEIHSRIEELESPFAFDVKTREEAEAIDEREEVTESGRASAEAPRSATRVGVGTSDGEEDTPKAREPRGRRSSRRRS